MNGAMQEREVPAAFSRVAGVCASAADGSSSSAKRQLRLLDSFSLHEPGRAHLLLPVEALRDRQHGAIVASGTVVQPSSAGPFVPSAEPGAGRVAVTTGPVLDWCLEYGDHPAVWIITAAAWYRLLQPSSGYTSTYASLQARFDLCVRCRAALCAQPSAATDAVQQSVLAGVQLGGSSSRRYDMQELMGQVHFLAGQMKALQQAGAFQQAGAAPSSSSSSIPFLDWLNYQAAYAAATAPAAAAGDGGADGPAAKRRRISEVSGTQGAVSAAAGGSAAAGPKPAGNKLKIKFKPAQAAAAAEPPADRSSQVQGAPAAVAGAGAAGQQLQRQMSANPSQMTAASTGQTGQSQRGSLVKTKLKFLPKGPRPGGAGAGASAGPGVKTPAAAAAAATPSPAGAAAVAGQAAPTGAFVQQALPPSVPAWDAGGYSQPTAARPQQQQPLHLSTSGGARQPPAATYSARAAASNSKVAEAKQRRAARERELQLKSEAEAAKDAARGPPPPPSRSSRLPAWALGEVLTLWELCQCFAAALQVPSFSLEMLEAALLPGPLDADEQASTAAAVAAAADTQAVQERAALAAAKAAAAEQAKVQQPQQQQQAAVKAEAAAGTGQEQQEQQAVPTAEANQEQPQTGQQPQSGQPAQQQQQQQGGPGDAMEVDAPSAGQPPIAEQAAAATGSPQQQQQQEQQQEQQAIKAEEQVQPAGSDPVRQEDGSAAAAARGSPSPAPAAAATAAADMATPAAPEGSTVVKAEEGAATQQQQQQQQQQAEPDVPEHAMLPPPPQQQQQQQAGQPAAAAATAAAAAAAAPSTSASTCTGSVAAPTASNTTSMGTAMSPAGRNLKIKVKLGKVTPPPAAGAAAGAGVPGGVIGGAAAAGQQQLPPGIDAAAAAAMGLTPGDPAAGQQDAPEQQQEQEQQQGGTAWMAQAEAAAVAAAAAVSAAAIEAADADADADPANGPQHQQQAGKQSVGITDAASLPSSLLLRDIHTGLIRLGDGTGPKPGKRGLRPPPHARLCPTESQRQLAFLLALPHWSQRAAQVVKQAGAVMTGPEPQEAATQLLQSDYALLSLEPRLALLRVLTDFAFLSELARSHLDARTEAYVQARALGKPVAASNAFSVPPAPAAGAGGSAEAAAEHATAVRMLEEWVDWVELQSRQAALSTDPIPTIGLRRSLGSDVRRRRYWVLGGGAGAWRVYCEEGDSSNWGFYEGAQLLDLITWLASGTLESEAPLLAALTSIPWPYKPALVSKAVKAAATAAAASAGVPEPQSPSSFTYWAGFAGGHGPGSSSGGAALTGPTGASGVLGFTAAQAGVRPAGAVVAPLGLRLPHPLQLMGSGEMQGLRPNGYLRVVAPSLYGEADIPGGAILGSTDERLRLGFDCLMAQVPFWLAGQREVVRHLVDALHNLNSAYQPGAYTQALLQLEAAMSADSLGPHSPLEAEWSAVWRGQWVASLSGLDPPSWEGVGLHLSMLGRHVVPRALSMSREAFFTTVEGSRCKLGFPAVGEVVCLVRSGCLLHLSHYGQLPDYTTAPLPPPAAELNAAAEVVKSLPPVSKYKVVAVAYCQYPKPTPPPVPQQPLQQQQLLEAAGGSAQLGQNTSAGNAAAAGGGGPAMQQGQQQAVQQVQGAGYQQPQQQQQGGSWGSSKKSRSRGTEWGLGDEDEFEDEEERSEDESESNSEDEEYNDRGIRLTGIDSDADGGFGSQQQQGGGSQSLGQQQSQQPSQQQQQQANGDAGAQQPNSVTPQQQQPQPVVVKQRPPCMWVLLQPVSSTGSDAKAAAPTAAQPPPAAPTPSPPPGALPQQEEDEDQLDDFFGAHLSEQVPRAQAAAAQKLKLPSLAVPLHIDSGLPDYLVAPGAFDASLQRRWLPQDRCSMFIGHRQRGVGAVMSADEFAQGTIIEIEEPLPGEDYDPWQSITVLWDDDWGHLNLRSKVSPWDVDTDVEERLRQEEEARKAAAAAAAAEELAKQEAAAEAAREKRRQNQRARLDQIGDLGVGAAERDDDDDYNPEEDSSDSEGGRRGRKARLARQMQLAQQGGMGLGSFGEPGGPPVFEQRRGRGRPPGRGRGRSSGLTWSATSGRGGRGSSAAGAGGPLAPPCGAPWTRQQVQEQQRVHLGTVQKGIAEALATNNAQMLAHWTSGAGGPQLPAPLSLDVLSDLPAEMEFLIFVAAYKNSQKPGFVPPIVNNREIDLYTLFMVVNVRGGYEAVCVSFRWQDICRCLGCEQGPSAVTAMRIAYERALLEFEQYVRSGRYQRERAQDHPPQWLKEDTDAALAQCRRAGETAAAQGPQGLAPGGPRGPAAVGPRGALPLGAAGAAGLMALPGGLPGVQLTAGNVALAQAQLAAAAQLRLQQAQLLAAQKAGRPVGAAGLVRPVQARGQPQAVNATAQQQLLMLQRAQLANNPQLVQALLLQQQQAQLAAAAAAGNARPPGTATAATSGVLTIAQIQQIQQLQQQRANAAAAAAGATQQDAAAASSTAAGAAAAQGPPASQAPTSAGGVNFSAMLDGA